MPICAEGDPDTAGGEQTSAADQDRAEAIARILKILRESGIDCELMEGQLN